MRFKALDVSAMQPAAALFLAPRIGHAESRLATTESIRHTGWLRKRGRIFAVRGSWAVFVWASTCSHSRTACGFPTPALAFAPSFQTWRRRFFELNGTDLTYHDREGAPAKGQVDCAMVRYALASKPLSDVGRPVLILFRTPNDVQLAAATHAPKSNKPYRFFIRSGKRDLYMQVRQRLCGGVTGVVVVVPTVRDPARRSLKRTWMDGSKCFARSSRPTKPGQRTPSHSA